MGEQVLIHKGLALRRQPLSCGIGNSVIISYNAESYCMLEIAVPGMNQPSRLRLTYKGKMLKWGYGINNRRSVLNRMKGNGRHLLAVLLTVGMIIGNMSGAVYADEIQPSALLNPYWKQKHRIQRMKL